MKKTTIHTNPHTKAQSRGNATIGIMPPKADAPVTGK